MKNYTFLIFLLFGINLYAQEKVPIKNIFLSSLGVQFSGAGDLEGSNFAFGYKRVIKNFHAVLSYEKFDYKKFQESENRFRGTNNFNAFGGYKLGKNNSFIIEVGPYISFSNERIIVGDNAQFLLFTKNNGMIIIPENTSYSYKRTTFGYSVQMKYLFKLTSNTKLGPCFQFQNDNYSTTVSSLRIGLEVGL
jgi:hypothetical protein